MTQGRRALAHGKDGSQIWYYIVHLATVTRVTAPAGSGPSAAPADSPQWQRTHYSNSSLPSAIMLSRSSEAPGSCRATAARTSARALSSAPPNMRVMSAMSCERPE